MFNPIEIVVQGKDEVTPILNQIQEAQTKMTEAKNAYNDACGREANSYERLRKIWEETVDEYNRLKESADRAHLAQHRLMQMTGARAAIPKTDAMTWKLMPYEKELNPRYAYPNLFDKALFGPAVGVYDPLGYGKEERERKIGKSGIEQVATNIDNITEKSVEGANKLTAAAQESGKIPGQIADKTYTLFDRFDDKITRWKATLNQLFTGKGFAVGVGMLGVAALSKGFDLARTYIPRLLEQGDIGRSQKARLSIFNKEKNYGGLSDEAAWRRIVATSFQTRTDLTKTADLVNKLLIANVFDPKTAVSSSIATAGLINRALIAGGGTAEENQRALLQLTQGLASGMLQGDELRSIREQAPYLMRALSQGIKKAYKGRAGMLGMTEEELAAIDVGTMKQLGARGLLTSSVLIEALKAEQEQINEDFSKMPQTVEQSLTNIGTLFKAFSTDLSSNGRALGKFRQTFIDFQNFLASNKGINLFKLLEMALDACAIAFNALANVATTALSILTANPYITAGVALAASIWGITTAIKSLWSTMLKTEAVTAFVKSMKLIAAELWVAWGPILLGLLAIYAIADRITRMATSETPLGTALSLGGGPDSEEAEEILKEKFGERQYNTLIKAEKSKGLWDVITESDWYKQITKPIKTENNKSNGYDLTKETANAIGETNGNVSKINDALNKGIKTNAKIDREDLQFMKEYSMHNFLVNLNAPAPQMTVNTGDINNGLGLTAVVERFRDEFASAISHPVQGEGMITLSGIPT